VKPRLVALRKRRGHPDGASGDGLVGSGNGRLFRQHSGPPPPICRWTRVARADSVSQGGVREGVPRGAHTGARTIERSCSRIVWIAEVDERRLALRLTAGGSSPSPAEGRTSAGSRLAVIQPGRPCKPHRAPRIRWRAPFDVSRKQAEGVLVDGRRPGSGKSLPLTRRRPKRVWRTCESTFRGFGLGRW